MDKLLVNIEQAQQALVNLDPNSEERKRLNYAIRLMMEQIAELHYNATELN